MFFPVGAGKMEETRVTFARRIFVSGRFANACFIGQNNSLEDLPKREDEVSFGHLFWAHCAYGGINLELVLVAFNSFFNALAVLPILKNRAEPGRVQSTSVRIPKEP